MGRLHGFTQHHQPNFNGKLEKLYKDLSNKYIPMAIAQWELTFISNYFK